MCSLPSSIVFVRLESPSTRVIGFESNWSDMSFVPTMFFTSSIPKIESPEIIASVEMPQNKDVKIVLNRKFPRKHCKMLFKFSPIPKPTYLLSLLSTLDVFLHIVSNT